MPIDCSGCSGLCCKHVNRNPAGKSLDRGDGTCVFLNSNNECTIYEHRPVVCNTDLMYKLIFSKLMTRKFYDRMNLNACEELKQRK